MMTQLLYFFVFVIGYIIMAQISKYLSVKMFHNEQNENNEKYKLHMFVSMNMIYVIMIVILDWFMGVNPSTLVILIAAGVITYLYATKLRDENSK